MDMGIRPFFGELLVNAYPLHADLLPCTHGCTYCFTRPAQVKVDEAGDLMGVRDDGPHLIAKLENVHA